MSSDQGAPKRPKLGTVVFSPISCVALLWVVLFAVRFATVRSGLSLTPGPVPEPVEMHRAVAAALRSMLQASRAVYEYRMSAAAPGAALPGKEAVTAADLQSHKLLSAGIGASSLVAVISEEGVDGADIPRLQPDSRLLLYVDPLDATQEYTESLLQYVSIAACLTRCGRPVAGLVTFPFTGRTYVGVVDSHWGGTVVGSPLLRQYSKLEDAVHALGSELSPAAFAAAAGPAPPTCGPALEAQQERRRSLSPPAAAAATAAAVADAQAAGGVKVIVTRSHFRNATRADGWRGMREAVEHLQALRPGSGLTRAGGAGYKLIEVLEGRADVYLHEGPIRKWDVCAGEALLRAAGGRVTDYSGADHAYAVPEAWWTPDSGGVAGAAGRGIAAAEERKAVAKTAFATSGVIAVKDPALLEQVLAVVRREL